MISGLVLKQRKDTEFGIADKPIIMPILDNVDYSDRALVAYAA
jgi:hypothetical protein